MASVTGSPFDGFSDGDIVEVTVKGKFRRGRATGAAYVGEYIMADRLVESVRLLEPEYEVGEIYKSALGNAYYRTYDNRWRQCKTGAVYEDSMPERPMRKLT